uniref:Uncharacterized protein n=1 Tax=Aegilops tauschii TaxID=37682 RepID=M8CC95_AEGTA
MKGARVGGWPKGNHRVSAASTNRRRGRPVTPRGKFVLHIRKKRPGQRALHGRRHLDQINDSSPRTREKSLMRMTDSFRTSHKEAGGGGDLVARELREEELNPRGEDASQGVVLARRGPSRLEPNAVGGSCSCAADGVAQQTAAEAGHDLASWVRARLARVFTAFRIGEKTIHVIDALVRRLAVWEMASASEHCARCSKLDKITRAVKLGYISFIEARVIPAGGTMSELRFPLQILLGILAFFLEVGRQSSLRQARILDRAQVVDIREPGWCGLHAWCGEAGEDE